MADLIQNRRRLMLGQPHPVTLTGNVLVFTPSMPGKVLIQANAGADVTIAGANLYDREGREPGYWYINSSGVITQSNASIGWTITGLIPVGGLGKLTYLGLATVGSNAVQSAWYKADKTLYGTFKQATGVNVVTVPDGVYYVRFTVMGRTGIDDTYKFALFPGDDTTRAYEAYSGITLPATTARTVQAAYTTAWASEGQLTLTYWTH